MIQKIFHTKSSTFFVARVWRRGGDFVGTDDFGRSFREEKNRLAPAAGTEAPSRMPDTAAWGIGERERVAP